MWHPFSGFSGSITSVAILGAMWGFCRATKKHTAYNLGPGGDPRAYEPIMNRYIRLAEFMIGAATGSIVLIIGSSAFHGQGGRLPWFYASPLILIGQCRIWDLFYGLPDPYLRGSLAWQSTLGGAVCTERNIRLQLSALLHRRVYLACLFHNEYVSRYLKQTRGRVVGTSLGRSNVLRQILYLLEIGLRFQESAGTSCARSRCSQNEC